MNALAFFETIMGFVALVCGAIALIFVLADMLCEYSVKLARKKKGAVIRNE